MAWTVGSACVLLVMVLCACEAFTDESEAIAVRQARARGA